MPRVQEPLRAPEPMLQAVEPPQRVPGRKPAPEPKPAPGPQPPQQFEELAPQPQGGQRARALPIRLQQRELPAQRVQPVRARELVPRAARRVRGERQAGQPRQREAWLVPRQVPRAGERRGPLAASPPRSQEEQWRQRDAMRQVRRLGPWLQRESTAGARQSRAPQAESQCAVPAGPGEQSCAVPAEALPALPARPPLQVRRAWLALVPGSVAAVLDARESGRGVPPLPVPASWQESPSAHLRAWRCATGQLSAEFLAARGTRHPRGRTHCYPAENARAPSQPRTLQSNWSGFFPHPGRAPPERQESACS